LPKQKRIYTRSRTAAGALLGCLVTCWASPGLANNKAAPAHKDEAMKKTINQQAVAADLEGAWLTGLEGAELAEGKQLIADLVVDWAREADSDPDPESVLAVQRTDLGQAARCKSAQERLNVLRVEVLQRKINRLSVASWALGTGVVDHKIAAEAARAEGQKLIAQADALVPRVAAIADADAVKRLRRDLNEVRMEALYAVEGKAMSIRLNRYQEEHSQTPRH
jgi:hypothetical protein